VPAEFLTDEQAAVYGRFPDVVPSQAELERFCFLDDADLRLVGRRAACLRADRPAAESQLSDGRVRLDQLGDDDYTASSAPPRRATPQPSK